MRVVRGRGGDSPARRPGCTLALRTANAAGGGAGCEGRRAHRTSRRPRRTTRRPSLGDSLRRAPGGCSGCRRLCPQPSSTISLGGRGCVCVPRQLHTIVAGGAACGERRLAGRCARACVHGTGLGVDIDGVAVIVVGGGAAGLAIVAVAAAFDAVADLDRLHRGLCIACCHVAAAGQRVIHEPRGLHALRFGSGTP